MRAATTTIWTLIPTQLPTLTRRCPRCDAPRTFACTGRVRVNANGKRLDAWLLLACVGCERSLRLTVHERVEVRSLPPGHLDALHRNDAATVARLAQQLVGEEASSSPAAVAIRGAVPEPPFVAVIRCESGAQLRLDRVLAQALGLSRAEVRRRWRQGWIAAVPEDGRALARRARDGQRIWVGG
ncbi:MAG: DUF1062 domain-containing protein [Myxococcales bacterium]|nr:DUF1062 domain-containing protein [Myxococcales bacterium]